MTSDTPVPLAERIAAVKRAIIFLEYTEEMALEHHLHDAEIAALQAALATLEQHDALAATLEDEQAAHQDTLRLWQEAKNAVTTLREQHERAMAVLRRCWEAYETGDEDDCVVATVAAHDFVAALPAAQETDRE